MTQAEPITSGEPTTTSPEVDLNFNFAGLTKDATETRQIAQDLERRLKILDVLYKALVRDDSYTGKVPSMLANERASAWHFREDWEAGNIGVESGDTWSGTRSTIYHVTPATDGELARLRFKPNADGRTFALVKSERSRIMGAAVWDAIEAALKAGWQGETVESCKQSLKAAKTRLQLIEDDLPSAETITAAEQLIKARQMETDAALASMLDQLKALGGSRIDIGFLDGVWGSITKMAETNAQAKRWNVPTQNGNDLSKLKERLERMEATLHEDADKIAYFLDKLRARIRVL